MLLGRNREIERLDRTLEAASSGRGTLCVLTGEPGIGKTRLADEVAARAAERGFLPSWGRAWETGGAPAYWPWIEVLGKLTTAADSVPVRVEALLGASDRITLGEGMRADPARERFELFDAVSGFVRDCARKRPLLLVFDDLHAADQPSLELLCFVARGLRSSRVLALCTCRDAESRLPRVADLLARMMREGEALLLRRLTDDEVAEIVRDELGSCDPTLASAVAELTEGNPLFLREALHAVHLNQGGSSLESLREIAALGGVLALVRGRLAGAAQGTQAVLEVAAVLGREFQRALLVEATAETPYDAAAALEDATARGLVVRRTRDRWAFSHVLVREAFYRELSVARRCALHHEIAQALGRSGASGSSLSTLAFHADAALPNGDPVVAVRLACRAATHARRQLAYEEAITLLERALSTCREYALPERDHGEVALALGWATTEAGQLKRGREVFREAARIGRRAGDAVLLARAALGQGGQYVFAEIRQELIDALREALEALEGMEGTEGDEARRLRARLLARLAAALTPSGTPEEPLGLARQALAMTAGETDARTRIDVDVGAGAAFVDFAPAAERIAVNQRLFRDARHASDRILELRALTRLSCDYIEIGDMARADATIAEREALAESIGHPRYQWQSELLRSMQGMPYGRFAECEAHIAQARNLATEALDPNAERCIEFHRFSLLLVAGRTELLREQAQRARRTLTSLVGNEDLPLWLTALTSAKLGDKARASEVLRSIGPSRCAARIERVTLLEAATLAQARELSEQLYSLVRGSDNSFACWGPFAFACTQPIMRTLAMAAFQLGRTDEATRHAEHALELVVRTGADAHRAWVHLAFGEGVGDREHLERAMELAAVLDIPEVTERARVALNGTPNATAPAATTPEESALSDFTLRFDCDRGEWTVVHGSQRFHVKDVRGLGMLARLIGAPGREIHVLDLVSAGDPDAPSGGVVDLGDAGVVLDAKARSAYKARLETLREDLDEAESWNDHTRAARARAEIEALTQQLTQAVGLGGRERRAGSTAERARIVVQRRVREAIKRIATHDPVLGRHLDWTVRTGTFCAYEPGGRKRR